MKKRMKEKKKAEEGSDKESESESTTDKKKSSKPKRSREREDKEHKKRFSCVFGLSMIPLVSVICSLNCCFEVNELMVFFLIAAKR